MEKGDLPSGMILKYLVFPFLWKCRDGWMQGANNYLDNQGLGRTNKTDNKKLQENVVDRIFRIGPLNICVPEGC